MEYNKEEFLRLICEEQPYKLVISNPIDKNMEFRKIIIRLLQKKDRYQYQVEKFTEKQAFHINIEVSDFYVNVLNFFVYV